MTSNGDFISNSGANPQVVLSPESQAAKFINPSDMNYKVRMSGSNSFGAQGLKVDGQKALIPDSMSNALSTSSLSQMMHPRSHQTGPSQK